MSTEREKIEKKILLLDFIVIKILENNAGYICKADKLDLFILPINNECKDLQCNNTYRLIRPKLESFENKRIISPESGKRIQPLKSTKNKISKSKPNELTKFESTYGNNLITAMSNNKTKFIFSDLAKTEALPIYVKLTKLIDGKNGNYKICDIKDITGSKKTITLNNTYIKSMEIGGVYYVKDIKLNSNKNWLYVSSTVSIEPATSDIKEEFKNIPCGQFLANKVLEWDHLNEYSSCPSDKKKLSEEFICPKCSTKFEAINDEIKDWRVNLIVMNSNDDDTISILLFKRNFIISSIVKCDMEISNVFDNLVDMDVELEYSERYNAPGQYVADSLVCHSI